LSEQLLADVLEELDVAPHIPSISSQRTSSSLTPPIVINVTNVLSQTLDVQMTQILASLDDLGLSHGERSQAEKVARELEQEAKGQQRWPVLSKSLETLRGLGKSVYERVAIPLLLEMLKKQAGL
jgi:hypothetical protein